MSNLKINQQIIKLAIPNILANVAVPLIGTLDTWLMGGLSIFHVGAIGLGAIIFDMVYWNFSFLRMGTTGMTAQAYGAKREDEQILILVRSIIMAIGIGLILVLAKPILQYGSFNILKVGEEHLALVTTYFGIRLLAGPATLSLYAFKGWFLGMQNAIFPMILTIITSVCNLVISYYLVVNQEMGVAGVAIGTVCAQYIGMVAAYILFIISYKDLIPKLDVPRLKNWQAFKDFMRINKDIFIRTFCLVFVFVFFFRQSSQAGSVALAASVIMQQFLNWMSYGIDGFAYATESLVGKYAGSKEKKTLHKTVIQAFKISFLVALLYSLTYWFAGKQLFATFTSNAEVIVFISPFLWCLALLPILGFACYIWDGIFVGLLASEEMRNSMLMALAVYLITFYVLQMDLFARIWLSLASFLISRGVIQTFYFYLKIKPKL